MGAIRVTTVFVLILISAVVSAQECVTGVRLLSTSASNPNLIAGPSAWSGSVLAVAKTQENVQGAVWVAVYGEGLETVTEDRLLVNDARSLAAMVWTGTEFGLFYRTLSQGLHLQRLTMLGDPIGAPVAITPARPFFAGDLVEVDWSPVHDAYVVAHFVSQSSARGLYITMLEAEGTQRSDRPVFVNVAATSPLELAITDSGAVGVFFITSNDLLGLAIVRESGDTPIVREVGPGGAGELVVAARDEQFVVARTVLDVDRTVIRWIVVDTSHQFTKFDALLLAGSGEDVHPQALIATDDEIALAYIDSPVRGTALDDTYRLRRFTISGTVIGDTAFAPTDLSALRAVSPYPFVWTGRSYLAAPVRVSSDRANSYLIRYCPPRIAVVAPRRVLVGETVTFTPAPSGGVPGYTYAWTFSNSVAVERNATSVVRTFTEPGTYTVTLVSTDANGIRSTTTFTFDVVYPRRRAARH